VVFFCSGYFSGASVRRLGRFTSAEFLSVVLFLGKGMFRCWGA